MRYKVQSPFANALRPATADKGTKYKGRRVHSCTSALLHLFVLLLFQISCSDRSVAPSPGRSVVPEQASPARIISLSPSITEVLYKLELGDRVTGVTRYCDFPPEVVGKPVVGGYFDVNYEMLLSLEPDLVIHMAEHDDARARLTDLGIATLAVNHSRVSGILESITTIADRCDVPEKGKTLRRSLESRIEAVRSRVLAGSMDPRYADLSRRSHDDGTKADTPIPRYPDQNPPRVLVAVGRLMDKGSGGEIFISGRDGFYDDLITLSGGVNVYKDETLKFPAISDEGLVRLDPDIIFEMVPDLAGQADRKSLMDLWGSKSSVRAVQEGEVYILGEDYVVVPGPRFILLLEDIAEIINRSQKPEARSQE